MDEKTQDLLQRRAEILAKPLTETNIESGDLLLAFYIGKEKYALQTNGVVKVIPYQKITTFQFIPDIFSGIIYYNGILWPVLQCKKLFKQDACFEKMSLNIVLLCYQENYLALQVDEIIGQYPCDKTAVLKKLITEQAIKEVIDGVYENDVALINLGALYELLLDNFGA